MYVFRKQEFLPQRFDSQVQVVLFFYSFFLNIIQNFWECDNSNQKSVSHPLLVAEQLRILKVRFFFQLLCVFLFQIVSISSVRNQKSYDYTKFYITVSCSSISCSIWTTHCFSVNSFELHVMENPNCIFCSIIAENGDNIIFQVSIFARYYNMGIL